MPTMKNITNHNFADLFSGEVQYIIPFFQRKYVWVRSNWNALYADIQGGILDTLGDGESLREHEHFFGPVVVHEVPGQDNLNLKAFNVIDGQQRITTVYLMLAYFRRRLTVLRDSHPRAPEWRDAIARLLENPTPRPRHDYDILKISSFKDDRLATWFAVRGKNNAPQTPEYEKDLGRYTPEGTIPKTLEKWLESNFGKLEAPDIWQWAEALTKCLQVVWIPLGEKDNPQAIFESLNAKGTPLSAIDLLVSYVFRPIIEEGKGDHEALHDKWLTAEFQIEEWGGNFEEYLRYLFSIGKKKMVGRGRKLYTFFKQNHPGMDARFARDKLGEIFSSVHLYGYIIGGEKFGAENPAIDNVLADIRDTGMHSCRPFLLAVLQAVEAKEMSAEDAEQILREVLALLVRCKITQRRTTQYDSLFPPLLAKIQHEPDMVAAICSEIRSAQFWVSDQEFVDGFVARSLYHRPGDVNFTRLVLRRIDEHLFAERNDGTERPNYNTLDTVEHIAPQTPTEGWLTETGCESKGAYNELPIHTIGNLCLRGRKENSGMGQSSFAEKKKSFVTSLSVLAKEISGRQGPWNQAAIESRSRDLAEYAIKIWAWSTVRD